MAKQGKIILFASDKKNELLVEECKDNIVNLN